MCFSVIFFFKFENIHIPFMFQVHYSLSCYRYSLFVSMLVLPINCFDRQLISCSEDGSVRIWELREKQQLPNEPVPTGLLGVWVKTAFRK